MYWPLEKVLRIGLVLLNNETKKRVMQYTIPKVALLENVHVLLFEFHLQFVFYYPDFGLQCLPGYMMPHEGSC